MPITDQMHLILNQGKPPQDAIRELMTRPATGE
jgi:glycerol-3-phosphate dehydrogenase